ncbi:sensor domain-containing diguanylate cyclase [Priestia koreensis]|uniref:sensor domain-containing diguanylate cyclase n=1 Tax=Priestia koreensis TaxID=284581 RepID=UPI003015E070
MNVLFFMLGIIFGVGMLQAYISVTRVKRRQIFAHKNKVFQLVETSKDIIYSYQIKPILQHQYTSPSVEYFLGEGVLQKLHQNSQTPYDLIHPDDYEIMQKKMSGTIDYSRPIVQRLKDMDGNYKWFEEYATPIYEKGELVAVQGIMRNIDEKMRLQKKLEYRLTHDPLTDVYNRDYFEERVSHYNHHCDESLAIILCDLDDLKYVNDYYGHKKGDDLIKKFATLLNDYFKGYGSVARIGGDEFAIVIPNVEYVTVKRLCENIYCDITSHNQTCDGLPIHMSVGYAYSHSSLGKMDSLFIEADQNMYRDKNRKKEMGSV